MLIHLVCHCAGINPGVVGAIKLNDQTYSDVGANIYVYTAPASGFHVVIYDHLWLLASLMCLMVLLALLSCG